MVVPLRYTNHEKVDIAYPNHPSLLFKMDKLLMYRLWSLVQDAGNDFSFIILISGDGMVRVGKSCLAQQIAYVLGEETGIGFDIKECSTVIFSGEDLIEKATYYGLRGERKIFWYDEARADMNSKQAMTGLSKTIGNFVAETGKFNHILILVLPDFFELEKRYALNYGEFLINCKLQKQKVAYRNNPEIQVVSRKRGTFDFFARGRKKKLYIMGKDFLNYSCVQPTFRGEFQNYWIINREIYEKKKDEFLKRDRSKKAEPSTAGRKGKSADDLIHSFWINSGQDKKKVIATMKELGYKDPWSKLKEIINKNTLPTNNEIVIEVASSDND